MVSSVYHVDDRTVFIQKALEWAVQFDSVCYLDSNQYFDSRGEGIDVFLAVGEADSFVSDGTDTFKKLQNFIDRHPAAWIPGFLGYDLKNEIENLASRHPNRIAFPDAYFFVPTVQLRIEQSRVEIQGTSPQVIFDQIMSTPFERKSVDFEVNVRHRMDRSAYFSAFSKLQQHIRKGDIYEVNLCQEFYAEKVSLHPLEAYRRLNDLSPTPFSCFFKYGQQYILSASPERFLSKKGNTLLSQPIKGTTRRGLTEQEDEQLKAALASNPKEISENIMIVDLVRNDLTKSAEPGTVKAPELLQIHSFKQVHQLISTITCQVRNDLPPTEAIQNTFPPGSMTGAPKISAMKLIDLHENSRRGVYSGAIGYFSPGGNFDFSVVIRTMLYNAENGYLSFHTGGAITEGAEPTKEYNECLLKGKALFEVLQHPYDQLS